MGKPKSVNFTLKVICNIKVTRDPNTRNRYVQIVQNLISLML